MTKANSKLTKHKLDPKTKAKTKKTIKKAKPIELKKDRPPGFVPKIGFYRGVESGQPGI